MDFKVGFEAEFLLKKDGNFVFPSDYKIDTDDFPLLAEIRPEPASDVPTLLANYYKEYFKLKETCQANGLEIDFSNFGDSVVSRPVYRRALKLAGEKSVPLCHNIYGSNIDDRSDTIIGEDGSVFGVIVSAGLHIHFSAVESRKFVVQPNTNPDSYYNQVTLPITVGKEGIETSIVLYKREERAHTEPPKARVETVEANLMTYPVIKEFIKYLDENLFSKNWRSTTERLSKYRQPGFYETKPDGRFEYRSLGMACWTRDNIEEIAKVAFSTKKLLEIPEA